MASGVAISDEVIDVYNQIKVRREGTDGKERYKFVMMRMSDDQKSIVVDESKCLKCKDLENEPDVFKKITSMLPLKECCYALYDCKYEYKDCSTKEDLVFIFSAPEDSPMRNKMLYSSSKAALKAKLQGMKIEWQINDQADRDASCLVEKLGGRSKVQSLEGKPL